nr:MAG TPA: hypothetical protein [Caudoviricetes sp.]
MPFTSICLYVCVSFVELPSDGRFLSVEKLQY